MTPETHPLRARRITKNPLKARAAQFSTASFSQTPADGREALSMAIGHSAFSVVYLVGGHTTHK